MGRGLGCMGTVVAIGDCSFWVRVGDGMAPSLSSVKPEGRPHYWKVCCGVDLCGHMSIVVRGYGAFVCASTFEQAH